MAGTRADLTQGHLYTSVLEAMAEAGRANSIEALHAIFRPAFRQLRLTLWLCLEVATVGEAHAKVLFGEGYEDWWLHYMEMDYLRHDPVMQMALEGLDALFWSDKRAEIDAAPHGEKIYTDARRFGLKNGFVDPLYRLGLSTHIVLLAGNPRSEPNHQDRAATHLVASYYGLLGRRILSGQTPGVDAPKLTKRQLECLRWVKEGKSSHDIADILGISSDVVDEHIAHACNRLGVRTRTQAAVIATMKGYL